MSQFIVSARKYRPLKFSEVVGQDHVTMTLKNALNTNKVAHAFLFCGPRGVGKTTCARILAKSVNCLNPGEDKEPCNTCSSCKSFNENASFNILELDAASNRGIDNMRLLIDQVRFQPQEGTYKVFIIDEVHMLTTEAFNAFLKTLEEPPAHAIFILATTEKYKILPTVLSRCQIYDFHRIKIADISNHLRYICKKEGITAEDEALRLIASKADGALRDSLSLFDRIATISEKEITYRSVIEQLNILDYDYYFNFVEAFLEEDVSKVILLYDEVLSNGFDGDHFLVGLADHLRQLLVALHPATHQLIEGSKKVINRYIDQSKKTSKGFLLTGLSLINECDIHYPKAKHKRLHVEICLSRICYMRRVVKPEAVEVKKKVEGGSQDLVNGPNPEGSQVNQLANRPKSTEGSQDIANQQKSKEDSQDIANRQKPIIPIAIPTIQSTSELKKEVKEEMDAVPQDIPILSTDILLSQWNKYVASIQGPSVKKLFDSSEIKLTEDAILVLVATQIARDTIAQDDSFIQSLRTKFHRSDLKMDIKIDEEKSEALKLQSIKPMNAREKFAKLSQANPKLMDLQNEFDLIPEGEI